MFGALVTNSLIHDVLAAAECTRDLRTTLGAQGLRALGELLKPQTLHLKP